MAQAAPPLVSVVVASPRQLDSMEESFRMSKQYSIRDDGGDDRAVAIAQTDQITKEIQDAVKANPVVMWVSWVSQDDPDTIHHRLVSPAGPISANDGLAFLSNVSMSVAESAIDRASEGE